MSSADQSVFVVEGVTSRLQADDHHDGKPCRCCGGEPHIYGVGIDLPGYKPPPYRDNAIGQDFIQAVAYKLKHRPGTRVRITVETLPDA